MKLLGRWQDLDLSTKGLIVVSFPAAATIAIACASYVIGGRAADAEQWVNHTLRVGEEIQGLKYAEVESSAHVRGYFITGEEGFAEQTRESLAEFDGTWRKLYDLTVDNPNQVQRLAQITILERSRVERIVNAMTRFQLDALTRDELSEVLKAKEVERLKLETVLKAMQREEDTLLEIRMRRLDSLRAELRAITATCLILGVAGGVVMSLLFASGVTSRIGKLQKNIARLATGGVLDPLPQGRDEIGILSDGMTRTAGVLKRRTAALELATHGIAEVDAGGRYVDFNRAYAQLTGLSEINSAPGIAITVHEDDRLGVEQGIAEMRESGQAEIEARVVHAGGRMAYIGMTFVPVSEDREGGYFIFLRDIQRRKDAEAALVHARDAAVASSRAKSEFLAKISHDIRTPLNAILGAADLLSQSPLDSDQAGYVAMFQRNCRRLVALINDFLDFSKIEAGVVRVENVPYSVRETVEEVVATFRESAYLKGLGLGAELARDLPEQVLGDPLRVHQVLLNLIGNAIKFTQHGRVDVKVQRIADAEGERLRFAVSDTGPGIRPEDQQRIFAMFEQNGKQDVSARNGCGLGLAICHQLVELMGGEIGVSSQEGSGSTFHCTLPLVPAQPGVAPPNDAAPTDAAPSDVQLSDVQRNNARPAGAGAEAAPVSRPLREGEQQTPRVLVAEDAEDNRLLLAHYLRGEPVELQFAENGQQAVDAIRGGRQFDLVLMDLDMPVLDGLGAIKAIRAWEMEHLDPPIPIVALSANAMRDAVRECLDAGCAAHVAKPVNKATLLSTIRRYHRSRMAPAPVPVSREIAALVPKYLASKLKQTEEARASLSAEDFDPIRRFGHNLKGTGLGYGFPQLELIGAEIEKSAMGSDTRSVSEQLEVLRRFLVEDAGVPVEIEVAS